MENPDLYLFRTLIGLVNIYSPTGYESRATDWLVEHMRQLNFTQSYKDEIGNAIGIMGEGGKQIILLGHIDTVEGNIKPKVENGRLYGRGTVDAKGPLASFVDAVSMVGKLPGCQLIVIGAIDEEGNSKGARALVDKYRPDLAIIGEPNQWDRIAVGYKGHYSLTIQSKQSKSHSARNEKSSCEKVLDSWRILSDWVDAYNHTIEKNFNRLQIKLMNWKSGEDGFSQWASIEISYRLPPDLSVNALAELLDDKLSNLELEYSGQGVDAFLASKNTPLVRAFLRSIRQFGGKPEFVNKSGTSDANIVAPYWNCPSIVYGPGDSSLDHTPDEHIFLDEYSKSVSVISTALLDLTN